jgi:hypothetical protein
MYIYDCISVPCMHTLSLSLSLFIYLSFFLSHTHTPSLPLSLSRSQNAYTQEQIAYTATNNSVNAHTLTLHTYRAGKISRTLCVRNVEAVEEEEEEEEGWGETEIEQEVLYTINKCKGGGRGRGGLIHILNISRCYEVRTTKGEDCIHNVVSSRVFVIPDFISGYGDDRKRV